MPELPEVETVVRQLDALVKGRRIVLARLIRERLAPHSPQREFCDNLARATLNFVHRRGKHVLFDLDNDRTLITHLRMSGRFILLPEDRSDPKFAHAVFHLDDGNKLIFDDQRHFGLMRIVETRALYDSPELAKLAPEPFSDEFSQIHFAAALKRSKRNLKEFLLDQTKVCGLGNIYASEAMFIARVRPTVRADRLTGPKTVRLHNAIRAVLRETIELGTRLPIDPANIGGSIYGAGSEAAWRVYGREGEPCDRCGFSIKRIRQGGRSTYFCPNCQRR